MGGGYVYVAVLASFAGMSLHSNASRPKQFRRTAWPADTLFEDGKLELG